MLTYIITGGDAAPEYVRVDETDGGESHEVAMNLLAERFANCGEVAIRYSGSELS